MPQTANRMAWKYHIDRERPEEEKQPAPDASRDSSFDSIITITPATIKADDRINRLGPVNPSKSKLPKMHGQRLSLNLDSPVRRSRSLLDPLPIRPETSLAVCRNIPPPSPTARIEIQQPRSGSISTSSHSPPTRSGVLTDPPPWDRSVDVVWRRRVLSPDNMEWDDELAFQENSARLADQSASGPAPSPLFGHEFPSWYQLRDPRSKDNARYFTLPDRVRFMIAKYVLADHDSGKAIRLNSPAFLDPIWPVNRKGDPSRMWSTSYFDSLKTVLVLLRSYTTVCFAMRVDILTALFLTRRFHVVYSPFVVDSLQPAATLFMDRFGSLMKWITVEVDLSRLGGSPDPAAEQMDMGKSTKRVRALVQRFANGQLDRQGITTIQSLVILVRRYYGNRRSLGKKGEGEGVLSARENLAEITGKTYSRPIRFVNEGSDGFAPISGSGKLDFFTAEIKMAYMFLDGIPYCSDEHLSVLDPIKLLEGAVDSLCIVGASKAYSHGLIDALWGKDRPSDIRECCQYRTPSSAYPFTPGQRSVVDYGPLIGVREVCHLQDPRKWRGLYGCALSQNAVVTEMPRGAGGASFYRVTVNGRESRVPRTLFPAPMRAMRSWEAATGTTGASISSGMTSKKKGNRGKWKEGENYTTEPRSRSPSVRRLSPSRIPVLKKKRSAVGRMLFGSSSGSSDTEQENKAPSCDEMPRRGSQTWRTIGKGLFGGKTSSRHGITS